jgi:lysophospholipase L1-like esterase
VAASGRGVTRNYADQPGTLVPELHALTLPDEPGGPRWDYARYQPDVTIVNLGANDYSTPGVDRARFRARYAEFLAELRRHYPKTKLLIAVGPTLNDELGNRKWTNIRDDLRAAIEARRKAGEHDIDYLEFTPQSGPWGEDWHPTRATHQAMAKALVAKLRAMMGW